MFPLGKGTIDLILRREHQIGEGDVDAVCFPGVVFSQCFELLNDLENDREEIEPTEVLTESRDSARNVPKESMSVFRGRVKEKPRDASITGSCPLR